MKKVFSNLIADRGGGVGEFEYLFIEYLFPSTTDDTLLLHWLSTVPAKDIFKKLKLPMHPG
jgi:hypothetical protein